MADESDARLSMGSGAAILRSRRPRLSRWSAGAAGVALLTLAATACGGDTAQGESGGHVTAVMGNNSTPDETYLPLEMTMQGLDRNRYAVRPDVQFQSPELALQALASNQIQFLSVPIVQAANAVPKLPGIRVITARSNNQWTFIAAKSVTQCRQLDGKKVGLFSTGGVSTAYLKIYFGQQCPGIKPTYIITADSTLRRQALLGGQILATPLQATDAVQVLADNSDKFHELANFGQTEPDIGRDVVLTNTQTLKSHPDLAQAFVAGQLKAIRSLYADPQKAAQLSQQILGKYVPTHIAQVTDYVLKNKLLCANGGLGDQNIATSLRVFGAQYGFLPKNVTVSQLVDTHPMDAALAQLGRSSVTQC